MKSLKILIILALVFLLPGIVYSAKLPSYSSGVINNPTISTAYSVQDPKYSLYSTAWYNSFTNVSAQNKVTFKIDRLENRHLKHSGDITINFTVNYETFTANSSGLTTGSQTKEIVLHYDTGYLAKDIDVITVVIDNAVKSSVTVNSVLYSMGVSYPAPANHPRINLENIIDIERVERMQFSYQISTYQIDTINNTPAGRPQHLRLSWATLPSWVEAVELEYTFVNYSTIGAVAGTGTYVYGPSQITPSSYTYDFRNDATRVFLEGQISSYEIPNLFPDGYILFRVRPVGKNYKSTNEWLQGLWSRTESGTLNLSTEVSAKRAYRTLAITTPSLSSYESKNSMTNIVFAEGGRISSTISYFDGTLRNRMSISYSMAYKKYAVQQSIFDYLGREAIKVIPSIAMDYNGFSYRNGYTLSQSSSSVYNYSDFDFNKASSDEIVVNKMKNTSGAAKYYSSSLSSWINGQSNLTQAEKQMYSFVPDAEGYPFAQVEFTKDPTGRQIRVGGIGKTLQLKAYDQSNALQGGHEVFVWDATPFQAELDVLFGSEIGYAHKYKKTLTRDQNGQLSVSYIDPYGKTVATALAGTPDTSRLDALESSSHSLSYFFRIPNTIEDKASGEKIINQHFLVAARDTWRFYYNYEIPKFNVPCDSSLCFSCGYTLSMSLKNTLGKELFPEGTPNGLSVGSPLPSKGQCSQVQKFSIEPNPITLVLDPGEYVLTKVLKIDEAKRTAYKKMWMDSVKCLKTFDDFLAEEKENMNLDCDMGCEQCRTEQLKLYHEVDSIVDYCLSHEIDTANYESLWAAKEAYEQMKNMCSDICMDKTPCDLLYDAMIQDLTPGGQYAKYVVPGWDGNDSAKANGSPKIDEGSIFQSINPKWWCNSVTGVSGYSYDSAIWRQPLNMNLTTSLRYLYLNDEGTEALIEVKNGVPEAYVYVTIGDKKYARPHQLKHYGDYIKYYEASWAKSLVYYHPEYCYYKNCRKINESYLYDNLLLKTSTAAEAIKLGFYNPLNMSYTSADTILIYGNVKTINYSSYEQSSPLRDPVLGYSFLNTNTLKTNLREIKLNCDATKKKSFWQLFERERTGYGLNAVDTCVDNVFWPLLRAHYLQQKREWLNKYYNDSCVSFQTTCASTVGGIRVKRFMINSISELSWENNSDPDYANEELWGGETGCNPVDVANKIDEQIGSYCANRCETNADAWLLKLANCPSIIALNSTQKAALKEDLKNLCISGCDLDNPYGSVTRSPNADATDYPNKDLADVLKLHLGTNWFVKGVCDDLLIDFPGEYGHDYLAYDNPDADTCACNQNKEVPASKRCPEVDTGNVKLDNCACDKLPPLKYEALSTLSLDNDLKCQNCITCDDLQEPVRAFLTFYKPEFEADSVLYQKLLTTWLNRKLKFNLTFAEYHNFALQCVDSFGYSSWVGPWSQIGLDRVISFENFVFPEIGQDTFQLMGSNDGLNLPNNALWPEVKNPFVKRPNSPYESNRMAFEGNQFYTDGVESMMTATTLPENIACLCEKILTVDRLIQGPPISSNSPSQLFGALYGGLPGCMTPFSSFKEFCAGVWNMQPPGGATEAIGFKEGDKFNSTQLAWLNANYPSVGPDMFTPCFNDKSCDELPSADTERDYLDTCACNMLKDLNNKWLAAGGKTGTGLEFKEYIYREKGVNPDNALELLEFCDKIIKTDFEKDANGITASWSLGHNFWSPISRANLNRFALNKNYTVPKSFACEDVDDDGPWPSGPACIKLRDCNTMKELINEYLIAHPLPEGESSWGAYNPRGCVGGDETNSAFDLLNSILGMEDEIARRERENHIHSLIMLSSGAGSGAPDPPYSQTSIDALKNWKNAFKTWFYDLNKDCDPMPLSIDFEEMMKYYALCKPDCEKDVSHYVGDYSKPKPYANPKCSNCYAIDTTWLSAFVKYNNQLYNANNSNNVPRLIDSKWLLYSSSSSYTSNNLSLFYNSVIYESRIHKDQLRYNIIQIGYPYMQIQIPDNNGYLLDYSMEYLTNKDWVNYGNITKFKNARGIRQQNCSPLQYFYVDVEQKIDKKYWDDTELPAGEEKCLDCPNMMVSGNPACKITYTLLVRVNTKSIMKKVQCMNCAKLCNQPLQRPVLMAENTCEEDELQTAAQNALLKYNQYLLSQSRNFDSLYNAKCFAAKDTFKVKYKNKQYHYTLYYYDRAGDLCKTVPPEGVDIDNNSMSVLHRQLLADTRIAQAAAHRANNNLSKAYTYHSLIANYKYNSIRLPNLNITPDGGILKIWYDILGRGVVSQNDKQLSLNNYSFTVFDDINRPIEAGEINVTASSITHEVAANKTDLASFLDVTALPSRKKQVVSTYYDAPANASRLSGIFTGAQSNLRNRVAINTYELVNDNNAGTYTHGVAYSYDIHGNVKQLVNDVVDLDALSKNLFLVEYTYDLLSKKVNSVVYQKGKPDQYHHQYDYNLDNQLTGVKTSRDGINWEQDAKYYYLMHGGLGRTELGQLMVQGVDYAYTLSGQLKSVNSGTLEQDHDMGRDGSLLTFPISGVSSNPHQYVARDAFGYYLKYFDGDYTSISAQKVEPDLVSNSFGTVFRSLYNGNIASMGIALPKINDHWAGTLSNQTLGNVYHYDQLNRITKHHVFSHLLNAFNSWPAASNNGNLQYYENFKYDANGNITKLNRNGHLSGTSTKMDGLTYKYHTEAKSVTIGSVAVTWTALKSNKLYHVNEAVSSALYANDVDDMGAFNSSSVTTGNNYLFDEIGNLKKDNVEQIQEIKWNAYGKVESITRTSGSVKPDLVFTYGADGQRLCKLTKPKDNSGNLKQELEWVYSYYVRDAQGNVMAICNKTMTTTGTANTYDEKLNVEEWSMYGQNRLGTQSGTEILVSQRRFTKYGTPSDGSWVDRSYTAAASVSTLTGNVYILTRGNKQYELSNHLGNVLVTVQDRKRSKDNNADNTADYYLPYLRTVTDYYAFGSPIYGRGGAIQKCSVVLVPRVITVKDSSIFQGSSTDGFTAVGSGVTVATSVNVLRIGSTMAYRPKANRTVSLHKGETYTLKFDLLTMSNTGASHSVRVRIYLRGSTITNIYSSTGTKTINFTSDTTFGVTVEFNSVISSPNNNHYIEIDNFSISNDTTVWENTNICGNGNDYRYGFNTQEKDNEVYGEKNSYTAEFWQYDPRLGRRWNVDPSIKSYESPFACFANNPIWFVDINGDDTSVVYDNYTGSVTNYLSHLQSTGNLKQGDKYTIYSKLTMAENGVNSTTLGASFYYAEQATRVWHTGNDYGEAGWYSESDYEYINRDWANGQVLEKRTGMSALLGTRTWNGWAVNDDGYLTGNKIIAGTAPDFNLSSKDLKLAKVIAQAAKHRTKLGIYQIYKRMKRMPDGSVKLYFGKTGNKLVGGRYTVSLSKAEEVKVLENLSKIPNNGIALGVEQAIMDLNGFATGKLANAIPATTNSILKSEAIKWLDENIENWATLFKFVQ